ncbi:mechanosensitive ion channel family protein [Paenibacillus senegalensis]|uniref:mechanosensitive ion channel family protein n=1 Tax=Paenibacillus senegalensis TaxID=1465766 RepID=UPI000287DD05|nr:mechanosensitive ion channel family protein [Paenibacillus senegalensis]
MFLSLEQYYVWITDNWMRVVTACVLFLLFLFLRKLFTTYIFKFILRISRKTRSEFAPHLVLAFEKPVQVLFVIIGLFFALQALGIPFNATTNVFIYRAFRSAIIVLIVWAIFNLSASSSNWIKAISKKFNFDIDQILIPILSRVIRGIIILLGISIIAQEWGYEISAFIAGLGLGGLAFALAAQDALKNIFGGVVIITEKPFSIGDWIQTPSVEGTVEEITFRSTRVRTFAQALVTVPNSTLANEAIMNWSRMGIRRITFELPVAYTTPRASLERSLERIREYLKNNPDIDQRTIFVQFDGFADRGYNLYFYFFTKTTVWGEWLDIKEQCNLKITQILEEEGVAIALPSTSVYFKTPLPEGEQTNQETAHKESQQTIRKESQGS